MIKLPIIDRREVAEKTNEVSFGLTGREFNFIAGQYIQLGVDNLLYPDPRGPSRLFSVVSSPDDKEKISIAFRQTDSGFKRTLLELPLNTEVVVDGPFGSFTLPAKAEQPAVFVAGGIGITPCLSMIRLAMATKRPGKLLLLYANRGPETAPYLEELKQLAGANPQLTVKNHFGPLNDDLIGFGLETAPAGAGWYIAGPLPLVVSARDSLSRAGVPPTQILTEEFTGY
ncbi:MAG: FAD-dependent oxidoreductase [Candidatus Paceibacterota bacterium]